LKLSEVFAAKDGVLQQVTSIPIGRPKSEEDRIADLTTVVEVEAYLRQLWDEEVALRTEIKAREVRGADPSTSARAEERVYRISVGPSALRTVASQRLAELRTAANKEQHAQADAARLAADPLAREVLVAQEALTAAETKYNDLVAKLSFQAKDKNGDPIILSETERFDAEDARVLARRAMVDARKSHVAAVAGHRARLAEEKAAALRESDKLFEKAAAKAAKDAEALLASLAKLEETNARKVQLLPNVAKHAIGEFLRRYGKPEKAGN
jgi:hypothetical protein